MQETAYTNLDLLNLTRWITLLFLILLIATPYLRQRGGEAQLTAFGNAVALANESQTEDRTGEQLPVWQNDSLGHDEGTFTEAGIESEYGKPSIIGVSGPLALLGDVNDRMIRGVTPKPAALHVSTLSPGEQRAGESKNNEASPRKKKQAHAFDGIIHKVAERYDVDPALVKAIIMAESSYNPKAVSRKGAQGLMQLMPSTARALGVKDSFNPEHNIDAGVRYFKQLLKQFNGDVKLAVAAYNAGSRKVRKYNGIPPFKYTRYYVAKVIEYHQRYQQ